MDLLGADPSTEEIGLDFRGSALKSQFLSRTYCLPRRASRRASCLRVSRRGLSFPFLK